MGGDCRQKPDAEDTITQEPGLPVQRARGCLGGRRAPQSQAGATCRVASWRADADAAVAVMRPLNKFPLSGGARALSLASRIIVIIAWGQQQHNRAIIRDERDPLSPKTFFRPSLFPLLPASLPFSCASGSEATCNRLILAFSGSRISQFLWNLAASQVREPPKREDENKEEEAAAEKKKCSRREALAKVDGRANLWRTSGVSSGSAFGPPKSARVCRIGGGFVWGLQQTRLDASADRISRRSCRLQPPDHLTKLLPVCLAKQRQELIFVARSLLDEQHVLGPLCLRGSARCLFHVVRFVSLSLSTFSWPSKELARRVPLSAPLIWAHTSMPLSASHSARVDAQTRLGTTLWSLRDGRIKRASRVRSPLRLFCNPAERPNRWAPLLRICCKFKWRKERNYTLVAGCVHLLIGAPNVHWRAFAPTCF